MANSNGHIAAPVNTGDVASVLGIASSDVATLCTSDKINPYSLIRPIPAMSPGILASQIKTYNMGSEQKDTQDYKWERKLWGYQVPYVENPLEIANVRDIAWYKPLPSSEHYKSLNHFDGYLHNAVPTFTWMIAEGRVNTPLVVNIMFGVNQSEIISDSGKGNKGGVVSVQEVFGDETFYYGITVQYGSIVRWFYGGSISPNEIPIGTINTGLNLLSGLTYTITPWIANLPETNGNLPIGGRYYSLNFAPGYESTKTISVREEIPSIVARILETDEYGQIRSFELRLDNPTAFAYRAGYFNVTVTEFRRQNDGTMQQVVTTRGFQADLSAGPNEEGVVVVKDVPFNFGSLTQAVFAIIEMTTTLSSVSGPTYQNIQVSPMMMRNEW